MAKTLKRILYGIAAVVFFFIAGRDFQAAGLTLDVGVAGTAGLLLGFMAATGKG